MNVKNNKRHQEIIDKLENAFVSLLRNNDLNKISVTELCEVANVDRSTFYANYDDISTLAHGIAEKIENQIETQLHADGEFAWVFEYIKANSDVFEIYFKLGISKQKTDYKMLFFRTGVYSVAKKWFEDGCEESEEHMAKIIKREYDKLF